MEIILFISIIARIIIFCGEYITFLFSFEKIFGYKIFSIIISFSRRKNIPFFPICCTTEGLVAINPGIFSHTHQSQESPCKQSFKISWYNSFLKKHINPPYCLFNNKVVIFFYGFMTTTLLTIETSYYMIGVF